MDFRRDMLDRIDCLGLEIECMKDDVLGLESQIEEIHEYIEHIEEVNVDVVNAINKLRGKADG